jgi:hypothetical protein
MKNKLLYGLLVCLLAYGVGISSSTAQEQTSHSVEIGYLLDGEFFPSNSFLPSDMVSIKFQHIATSPITSFSVFIADTDVTNYVIENALVTINGNHTELSVPQFPAIAVWDATGSANNFVTFTVNGESYSTLLFVESSRKERAPPVAVAALATACAAGAASSVANGISDMYFNTSYKKVAGINIPYPTYNGKTTMTQSDWKTLAPTAALGCSLGLAVPGVSYLLPKHVGVNQIRTQLQKALVEKIEKSGPALAALLKFINSTIDSLRYANFSHALVSVPTFLKEVGTRFTVVLGIKETISGIVSVVQTSPPTSRPISSPKVSSVTPLTVRYGQRTTFTVRGTDLPSTLAFWIDNCQGVTSVNGGTATSRSFTCTPSFNKIGTQKGGVKDKAGGTILYSIYVDVRR